MVWLLACSSAPLPVFSGEIEDPTPFLDQLENGSFEAGEGPVAEDWSPVPGDGKGWSVEATPAAADGSRAAKIVAPVWYCAGWKPVRGVIRVTGKVRGVAVKDTGNPKHGASVSLRLKGVSGAAGLPVLGGWSGDFDWTDFRFAFQPPPEATAYRACVGLNSTTGEAWFDAVRAGSADEPPMTPLALDGSFDAGTAGWEPHPDAPVVTDAAVARTGASVRFDRFGLLCTPWQTGAQALGMRGQARAEGAGAEPQSHRGLVLQARSRKAAGAETIWPLVRFADGDWRAFEKEWPVPEDAGEARLCFGRTGATGTLWIDEVTAWTRAAP